MAKKVNRKDSIEKIILWVGSICGIVVAGFTIWDRIIAASPPDMGIVFSNSQETNIYFSPPVNDSREWTDSIPLSLSLSNSGGKTAEDITIQLTYFVNLRVIGKGNIEHQKLSMPSNEVKEMTIIHIKDLHPESTIPLDVNFQIYADDAFKKVADANPDSNDYDRDVNPLTIPIDVEISAKEYKKKKITLTMTLGSDILLKRYSDKIYFMGYDSKTNERGILLIKEPWEK